MPLNVLPVYTIQYIYSSICILCKTLRHFRCIKLYTNWTATPTPIGVWKKPTLPTYLPTPPPHCTLASPLICDARYSRIRSRSRSGTRPALRGAPISSLTIERVLRNVLQISPHEADKEGDSVIEKERDEVIERERGMQRTREELLPQWQCENANKIMADNNSWENSALLFICTIYTIQISSVYPVPIVNGFRR